MSQNRFISLAALVSFALVMAPVMSLTIENPIGDQKIYLPDTSSYDMQIPATLVNELSGVTFSVDTSSFPSWLTYDQASSTLTIQAPVDEDTPVTVNITATFNAESAQTSFTLRAFHREEWDSAVELVYRSSPDVGLFAETVLSDGNIISVWRETVSGNKRINGKIVNPVDGTVIKDKFSISEDDGLQHRYTEVAQVTSGQIIVVWSSESRAGIDGKIFNVSDDVSTISQVRLVDTASEEYDPTIVSLSTGGFFMAWSSYDPETGVDAHGAFFNALGQMTSSVIIINDDAGSQMDLAAKALGGDRIAVTWNNSGITKGPSCRIINPDGSMATPTFRMATMDEGQKYAGRVTDLSDDRLFMVWSSWGHPYSGTYALFGRVIKISDQTELVPTFMINNLSNVYELRPEIATLQDGNILISWEDEDSNWHMVKLLSGTDYSILMSSSNVLYSPSTPGKIEQFPNGDVYIVAMSSGDIESRKISLPVIDTTPACDTTTVDHRYNAINWLKAATPDVTATRETGSSDLVFIIPNLDSCLGQSITITAAHASPGGYTDIVSTPDKTESFVVTMAFEDSFLTNTDVCVGDDQGSDTVVYACTIYFQSFFENDFIVNWEYGLTLTLQGESVIGLGVGTDTRSLASDNVPLNVNQSFVAGFDGSSRPDGEPFIAGDDAFIAVNPPAGLNGSVTATISSVVVTDKEANPDKDFIMTSLAEAQVVGDSTIVRVPLIIVSDDVEITVQIEWSLNSSRRRLEESDDENQLVNYTASISVLEIDTSDSQDEEDSESSETNWVMFTVVACAVALTAIAITFAYRTVMKNKRKGVETQGQTAIPVQDLDNKV